MPGAGTLPGATLPSLDRPGSEYLSDHRFQSCHSPGAWQACRATRHRIVYPLRAVVTIKQLAESTVNLGFHLRFTFPQQFSKEIPVRSRVIGPSGPELCRVSMSRHSRFSPRDKYRAKKTIRPRITPVLMCMTPRQFE
jgi:hypothetical protein